MAGKDNRVVVKKDFIGNDITIGSKVIFMRVGYRDFTTGTIISMGNSGGTIALSGCGTSRQKFDQMIRCPYGF